MSIRTIAVTATILGSMSAAALGLGAGMAQAKPGPHIPGPPPVPGIDNPTDWRPLPPGQIKQYCPWQSPPGHWIGGPHGIPCT
jgi:hypothetical protein